MPIQLNIDPKKSAALVGALAAAFFAGLALWYWAGGEPSRIPAIPPHFTQDRITIESSGGQRHAFDVDVAITEEQQGYGLKFREDLPRDSGMLFLFKPAREVIFWMEDTLIPLDMLFIRGDGTIVKIVRDAQPKDLSRVPSGEPVAAVLEIYGGEADRRGIREGDKGLHAFFESPPEQAPDVTAEPQQDQAPEQLLEQPQEQPQEQLQLPEQPEAAQPPEAPEQPKAQTAE